MAWVSRVVLDKDKTDVASVSAVFTDTDATTFSHAKRIQITAAARDAFINEAIALRNAWQSRKTDAGGYEANVDARFVELDT